MLGAACVPGSRLGGVLARSYSSMSAVGHGLFGCVRRGVCVRVWVYMHECMYAHACARAHLCVGHGLFISVKRWFTWLSYSICLPHGMGYSAASVRVGVRGCVNMYVCRNWRV